ncbi:MAG: hypothetical protein ACRDYA_12120 [Egibacteraceae bacterium]
MRLIEHPPATPRRPGTYQPWEPPARRHPTVHVAVLLIGVAWRWRIELAAVTVAVTIWGWLATVASRPVATIITVALWTAAVLVPARVRARLGWIEQQARLRRRWARACRHAGLETFNERTPRVTRIGRAPVGEVLRVRMPAGQNCADLQSRAETLAAYLQVCEVQVARDPGNARYTEVRLVRRDALAGTVRLA